nr:hypothetical protein 87 [bacterium]
MKYTLLSLIKSSIEDSKIRTKIASAILRYSNDVDARAEAAGALGQSIEIDVFQLESMINPDKFEFPELEIGEVVIENDE